MRIGSSPELELNPLETEISEKCPILMELVGDFVARVRESLEMFNLPNKPRLVREDIDKIENQLWEHYSKIVQREKVRDKIKFELTSIQDYEEACKMLELAPKEAALGLVRNLGCFPEGERVEVIRLLLQKAPKEAAPELAKKLEYIPEGMTVEVVSLLLQKAPKEAAPELAENLGYFPEGVRLVIAWLLIEKAPKEAALGLVQNLGCLPKGVRVELARLLLQKAPKEAALELAWNIECLPEEDKAEFARLLLQKAPKEAAPELAKKLEYLPEGESVELARLLVEMAPKEVASELAGNLKYLLGGARVELARLLLQKAPKEAASGFLGNLIYFPKEFRVEIVGLLIDKALKEAASGLAWNLGYLPKAMRVEVIRLLLQKAPKEAAPGLAWNLGYLPRQVREEFLNLLLEKAPREAESALANCFDTLRKDLQIKVKQALQVAERARLLQAEKRNPVLYKNVSEEDEQFSQREFIKTGTRTLLLGGSHINNVILRIIPDHAFISWMKAYTAVDTWRNAGFNYVPIEPIINARAAYDGENTRVYSGVLGVSVREYLLMNSTEPWHEYVEYQVWKIIDVLDEIGIDHGHTHYSNFCILHERTAEGEIDWNKPPRVYCIDFDESVSL